VTPAEWQWYGLPGHFVGARYCRFHLCTGVGGFLVSTVGSYRPNGAGVDIQVGADRMYETMVFRIDGTCDCGCGEPAHSGRELDMDGYNDAKLAREGHLAMCQKWSRKRGAA